MSSFFTVFIFLTFGTLCPVSSAHSYLVIHPANKGHKTKSCNLVSKLYEYHPVSHTSKIAQGLQEALFLTTLLSLDLQVFLIACFMNGERMLQPSK